MSNKDYSNKTYIVEAKRFGSTHHEYIQSISASNYHDAKSIAPSVANRAGLYDLSTVQVKRPKSFQRL